MPHWPSGIRDTTEFPTLNVEISANLREHLRAFIQFDGLGWSDYSSQSQTSSLSITDQRLRSYRKMYEKLGLIYNDSGSIRLSSLGRSIQGMERALEEKRDWILSQARKIAISILSRYQLRNPANDYDEVPNDCDVLPNICIWKAMVKLDGKLHSQEMNRVILHVMHMSELDLAISKIKIARESLGAYSAESEANLTQYLGQQVHTNQPEARIAAWFSLSGWGGLIIGQNNDNEGYRHLIPESEKLIEPIVNNPPEFYEAQSEEDWFRYYIGDAAVIDTGADPADGLGRLGEISDAFTQDLVATGLQYDKHFVNRFIASCISKPFVILTGLSGSGKTKLAQAFAGWMAKGTIVSDPFQIGAQILADRVKYTVSNADRISVEFSREQILDQETKVLLPRELIDEWVKCIKKNSFTRNNSAREIREKVSVTTHFSSQLNSFETHLKAAAFVLIESDSVTDVKNYAIVSVGPDWIGRDSILGYPDALDSTKYVKTQALDIILKAQNDPTSPYFLILDEMNLSHVERYFSDILSALESRESIFLHSDHGYRSDVPPTLSHLPGNLFIIGTVNIDETTYMFSPKVLDRANTIEFTVSQKDIINFLQDSTTVDLELLSGKGRVFSKEFLKSVNSDVECNAEAKSQLLEELLLLFNVLSSFELEFGFRTAKEITRYVGVYDTLVPTEQTFELAMDAQIVQKVLPKFHGSRKQLEPILCALANLCFHKHEWDEVEGAKVLKNRDELLAGALKSATLDTQELHPLSVNQNGNPRYPLDVAYFPISFKKITRMLRQLENNGFASFAEA